MERRPFSQTDDESEPTPQRNEPPKEEKQCRICLAGEDEVDILGRLFSPCRCKGTMRYVHVECLNAWRKTSQSSTSFFKCDQCGYKYHTQRSAYAQYITHNATVTAVTILAFLFSIFISGFLMKLFLIWYLPENDEFILDSFSMLDIEFLLDIFPSKKEMISVRKVDIWHFLYGTFLVGFVGCFNFMLHMVLSPRFGRRGRRTERDTITAIFIIAIILWGVYKSTTWIYKRVKENSKYVLQRLEDKIMDVNE